MCAILAQPPHFEKVTVLQALRVGFCLNKIVVVRSQIFVSKPGCWSSNFVVSFSSRLHVVS